MKNSVSQLYTTLKNNNTCIITNVDIDFKQRYSELLRKH